MIHFFMSLVSVIRFFVIFAFCLFSAFSLYVEKYIEAVFFLFFATFLFYSRKNAQAYLFNLLNDKKDDKQH